MSVSLKPAVTRRGPSLSLGTLRRSLAWVKRLIARHPDASAYLAILLLVVIWHRGLIFEPGYLGLRDDWTTPPTAWQNTDFALDRLSAWQSNFFGQSEEERAMSQYLQLSLGALTLLPGIDGWLTSRVAIVFLALAGVFMYQAAKRLDFGRPAALTAAVVYMTTPFFLDAFVAGYTAMLIGVALLPKAVQVTHETFDKAPGVRGFVRGSLWIGPGCQLDSSDVYHDRHSCRLCGLSGFHGHGPARAAAAAPGTHRRDGPQRRPAAPGDRLHFLATHRGAVGKRGHVGLEP